MSPKYLVKGGKLANGQVADIAIVDGLITEVGANLSLDGSEEVDAKNCVVIPGLVDLHTHLREPGKEDAETVLSGSHAAAKGGYVAVSAMANTSPVADTAGVVEQVFR